MDRHMHTEEWEEGGRERGGEGEGKREEVEEEKEEERKRRYLSLGSKNPAGNHPS